MRIFKRYFVFILILVLSNTAFAQKNYKYHTGSRKAIKLFELATQQYDLRKNATAVSYLKEAIAEDAEFIEAHTLLGDVYFDQRKYDDAVDSYQNAIRIDPQFFPKSYKNLARAELQRQNYDAAIEALKQYVDIPGLTAAEQIATKEMYDLATFRKYLVEHPVPFEPLNLGAEVNSENNEYIPTLTADNQTLIFTRRFPKTAQGVTSGNYEEEDLFTSTRINGAWSDAKPLSSNINSDGNEGSQCLSPDGKILYFTACDRKTGYGSCDIYYARKVGNNWSAPTNIGKGINSNYWESQPSISADGQQLYFVSNRPGGKGIQDIWMSTVNENGFWTKAVNLGDSINTKGQEFYPFIHPDNKTLYFSSDGHMGMGGMDIFFSRRDESMGWGKPVNIGYPINSASLEHGLMVSNDGTTGYFSSDRLDGQGNLDLYYFDLYEGARPQIVSYIKGVVIDADSNDPLDAAFEIIDLENGEVVLNSSSDKVNGEFLISLPSGKDYALNVSRNGYLFYSDHFSSNESVSREQAYLLDVKMKKAKTGEKVVLKNIFFESNSFVLMERSTAELEKLHSFLVANKGIGIEIGGYTDNVGAVSDNQLLSQNRAKAVFNYLEGKGIESGRLKYKGYGESSPIADNATEEGRALNRRTEFKIMSVN